MQSNDNFGCEYDDIEDWEILAELKYKKDYPWLVQYCEERGHHFF